MLSYKSLVRRHEQTFELNIWLQLYKFDLKNVFMSDENGVENITKKKIFFFAVLSPILKFLLSKQKTRLHVFCCSQNCVICHTLSWHCTVPSWCPDFSSASINSTLTGWLLWAMDACLVLVRASQGNRASAFIVLSRAGWAGLRVTHRLCVGLACPSCCQTFLILF